MCRMLALASRQPVPEGILLSFRRLAETGKNYRDFGCPQAGPKTGHPDGWGLACLAPDGEVYARSTMKATEDPKYEEVVHRIGRVCSPPLVLLAHVRHASFRDSIQERYCHPFRREMDGRAVFFAHNGEIAGMRFEGDKIDSQIIMERFLEALGAGSRSLVEVKQALDRAKEDLDGQYPRKVTSYTFLLAEEGRVLAHRDARTCVPYYTLHETRAEGLHIVCSEVLPTLPGRWRMLRNGEFLELRP